MPGTPVDEDPQLLEASAYSDADIGEFTWDEHSDLLTVTNDGRTIEWAPREEQGFPPSWVPAATRLHLHSGRYRWDMSVDELASGQIGVGFMLLWNVGPDWGFYGYLGSSASAWSYDLSTGDVVCETESIEGGLPKSEDGRTGVVTVELDIPRDGEGTGRFIVAGSESKPIPLPVGAVVLPAACLLKVTQKVTLGGFERR